MPPQQEPSPLQLDNRPLGVETGAISKTKSSIESAAGSSMYMAQVHAAGQQCTGAQQSQRPTGVEIPRPDGVRAFPDPQHLHRQLAGKVARGGKQDTAGVGRDLVETVINGLSGFESWLFSGNKEG